MNPSLPISIRRRGESDKPNPGFITSGRKDSLELRSCYLESSPLYALVRNLDLSGLKSFIHSNDASVNLTDRVGFTPLMHLVCSEGDCEPIIHAMKDLVDAGADVNAKDNDGFSICHWAAASGQPAVLQFLVTCVGIDPLSRCHAGETPLHRACRLGKYDNIRILLLSVPYSAEQVNQEMKSPLQVAGCWMGVMNSEVRSRCRLAFSQSLEGAKTVVFSHDDCLTHISRIGGSQGTLPWESCERIEAIMHLFKRATCLKQDPLLTFSNNVPLASNAQILRCHSRDYLTFLECLDSELQGVDESIPFTPTVQRVIGKFSPEQTKSCTLSDTTFSPGTLIAARRACGAVAQAATDCISGKIQNGFCIVRPPGHHVGFNGPLLGSCQGDSCGFSILNSVMVAASEIVFETEKKVAIIDLDVHHGNGTEDIVKRLNMPDMILFVSTHLCDQEFYPYSGSESDYLHNIHNFPIEPLWKGANGGREAWLNIVQRQIIPLIVAFRPDIILLSMGFDGAIGDVGNCRHSVGQPSLAGLDLIPSDYTKATEAIYAAANIVCHGRIVSVLEGGYGKVQWIEKLVNAPRKGSFESNDVSTADSGDSSPDGLRCGRKRQKLNPVQTQIINRQPLAQSASAHLKALLGLIQS